MMTKFIFPLILLLLVACKEKQAASLSYKNAKNELFLHQGRTTIFQDSSLVLINSAASVAFVVKGDSVNIYLQTNNSSHNYVVLEINDKYSKRCRIDGSSINMIPLKLPNQQENKIGIYKATESSNGSVIFHGVDAEGLLPFKNSKTLNIEFIGNSITCGMGADTSEIPCGEGEWFDQHNAYLAYGPRVARALNANFILNSVSGIGMYRNWNDENIEEPIMPQVYENLYLNLDSSKKYDFKYNPDIVSICLGTNDLSDGDGIKPRLDFNKLKFINNYINFVENIYKYYPTTKIALLNSPMVDGEKGEILLECLKEVKNKFSKNHSISIFEFNNITPNGCMSHPDIENHVKMAEQLVPFFKNLLNNN